MNQPATDFFNEDAAQRYDERNSKLAPISHGLHFLIRVVLKDLPARSKVLCVGAGTGAEIISLSQAFPEWTFVALDPSLAMLDVCRQRVQEAGLMDRCEFVHGFVQDIPARANFDAALAVLVAHFVDMQNRLGFFRNITDRLRTGGYLVNAEISFDLDSAEFSSMLKSWEGVQALMGATPESLAKLPDQLRQMLTVISPLATEDLIRQSGIDLPIRFFQALMICGWYGIKNNTGS